jgi:spoIIIJ-associated protein
MAGVEESGKNVQAATEKALHRLGLDITQVDITVLSEGRGGFLGIGSGQARVRVEPRDRDRAEAPAQPSDDDIELAVDVLESLLRLMGVEADVRARAPETPGDGAGLAHAVLDVHGDDLGILIGRRGGTLMSLQYVVNLMVSRKLKSRTMFAVDVEGYRRRREESLMSLAARMADRVKTTGQTVTLEPMPPNERRIIHLALAEDPKVVTVSIGDGESRKVAITPRR